MASTRGASSERNDDVQLEFTEPHGPAGGAETPPTDATTSDSNVGSELVYFVSADTVSRRDRRVIINTKDQLKKFMTDYLSAPLEYLA